jgi:hypothetical protein
VAEGIIGQFYLAIFVARLVGLYYESIGGGDGLSYPAMAA